MANALTLAGLRQVTAAIDLLSLRELPLGKLGRRTCLLLPLVAHLRWYACAPKAYQLAPPLPRDRQRECDFPGLHSRQILALETD